MEWFFLVIFIAMFSELIYFGPTRERKRNNLIFDNRVLATIDGLSLAGMNFGCADFEMRSHARRLLEKAHALPDNQLLLEHTISAPDTTRHGLTFRSHTGLHGEHIAFALLCIINYTDNPELIQQCERLLTQSSHTQIHY